MFTVTLLLALAAMPAVAADADAPRKLSAQLVEQVAHWQEQARSGDVNAMFNLGQYFRRGIGMEPDLQQARLYYEQAANKGHAGAQLNLGTLYYFGPDKPNLERVAYWWEKAALQGEAKAQYQLAVLYLKLPEPREQDALAWMTLAERNGDDRAKRALVQLQTSLPAQVQAGLSSRIVQLQAAPMVEPVSLPVAEPEPAPVAAPVVAHDQYAYTAQLASLSNEDGARRLAATLAQRHAALLGAHEIHVQDASLDGQAVYRLHAGAFAEREHVQALCEALAAAGQGCFPAARR
ncbi:SPOR domain-containing protein [Marinobacterium halophilum]|nr:SPOR domain-containing protein [Marinobacterium halophilum]